MAILWSRHIVRWSHTQSSLSSLDEDKRGVIAAGRRTPWTSGERSKTSLYLHQHLCESHVARPTDIRLALAPTCVALQYKSDSYVILIQSDTENNIFLATRDKMRIGADLRGGSERWQFADLYRVYLRISDHCRVRVRIRAGFRVRVWVGLVFGLGLRIVVYKLLEKVTKCGSITWLKLTNAVPPRRSAPLRILSCPYFSDLNSFLQS